MDATGIGPKTGWENENRLGTTEEEISWFRSAVDTPTRLYARVPTKLVLFSLCRPSKNSSRIESAAPAPHPQARR